MQTSITIEIDCAPGGVRPDTHFYNISSKLPDCYKDNEKIIKFTQKLLNLKHISARWGNWEWKIEFDEENKDILTMVQNHFQIHLTNLHKTGAIRFASW